MSIPLDRLYHYLESLSSDAIIIYRWDPHGSKKLEDLSCLGYNGGNKFSKDNRVNSLTIPGLICHDQEPLNYDFYSKEDFIENIIRRCSITLESYVPNDHFVQSYLGSHLRMGQYNFSNIYDYTLLCHSEKNSKELDRYEQNWFIGVYYWSHAIIARDWFRYAEHDPLLTPNFDTINTDFLIYNRAWSGTREYRLKFIEMLIDNNLVSNCNVKFNPTDSGQHYTSHKFQNSKFAISNHNINDTVPLNNVDSHASADYNSEDYTTSAIEVVLETLFDDTRQHLTEKILRPFACGRPFILASTPGSLEYLRSYGFKTFNGLIDESYDTIVDPLDRLSAIIAELARISALPREEKLLLWKKLYAIAEYNKQRFFSQEFHNDVSNEFKTNLASAVQKSKQHTFGHWWNVLINIKDIHLRPEYDILMGIQKLRS